MTSGVRYEEGSCAMSAPNTAANAKSNLRLIDRCRRARNAYYLRSRILQPDLTRDQADQGTKQQHPITQPYATDQRKQIDLEDGLTVVRKDAGKIHVEILIQPTPDTDDRILLLAVLVDPNFRVKLPDLLAVTGNAEGRMLELIIACISFVYA